MLEWKRSGFEVPRSLPKIWSSDRGTQNRNLELGQKLYVQL